MASCQPRRLKLLDLFCCAGGCGMGYHRAGFDVVGVDIRPQPRYPFKFHCGDAIEFLRQYGADYDVIHASPPCQAYTPLRALHPDKEYPDLVAETREALTASGRPWIIENVPGAPLHNAVMLCGTMFGLRVYRHRLFETSFFMFQPAHPKHTVRAGAPGTKGGRGRKAHYLAGGFITVAGNVGSYCGPAMGIDWMTGAELSQAIPPAYTEYIGRQYLDRLSDELRSIDGLGDSIDARPAKDRESSIPPRFVDPVDVCGIPDFGSLYCLDTAGENAEDPSSV